MLKKMNKKGYGNLWIIWSIIFGLIFAAPLWWFAISSASVTIERPYYSEWSSCESKLAEEETRLTPACSPCMPIKDKGYWFIYIIGFIVYIAILAYGVTRSWKLDAREKELKEREEQLNKPKKRK